MHPCSPTEMLPSPIFLTSYMSRQHWAHTEDCMTPNLLPFERIGRGKAVSSYVFFSPLSLSSSSLLSSLPPAYTNTNTYMCAHMHTTRHNVTCHSWQLRLWLLTRQALFKSWPCHLLTMRSWASHSLFVSRFHSWFSTKIFWMSKGIQKEKWHWRAVC